METQYPTPQSLFDAIEKETGMTLSPQDKMMIIIGVQSGQATPEQMFAVATHDCANCPVSDTCDSPHKKETVTEQVPDVFAEFINGEEN